MVGSDFALRILDPPMEGFEPVKRRGRVLKIASFEGPMILRVEKIRSFFSGVEPFVPEVGGPGYTIEFINEEILFFENIVGRKLSGSTCPRDPGSLTLPENGFMEPKYLSFQRWFYIICSNHHLTLGDWIPRDEFWCSKYVSCFVTCWFVGEKSHSKVETIII